MDDSLFARIDDAIADPVAMKQLLPDIIKNRAALTHVGYILAQSITRQDEAMYRIVHPIVFENLDHFGRRISRILITAIHKWNRTLAKALRYEINLLEDDSERVSLLTDALNAAVRVPNYEIVTIIFQSQHAQASLSEALYSATAKGYLNVVSLLLKTLMGAMPLDVQERTRRPGNHADKAAAERAVLYHRSGILYKDIRLIALQDFDAVCAVLLRAYLTTKRQYYGNKPIEDLRRLDIISQDVYSHFPAGESYQLLGSEIPSVVRRALLRQIQFGSLPDIILTVHGQILVAHKRLLSIHSSNFASLPNGPWTDSHYVGFGHHISPPIMVAVLDYIYSEDYDYRRKAQPHVDIDDLYDAADYFGIKDLVECIDYEIHPPQVSDFGMHWPTHYQRPGPIDHGVGSESDEDYYSDGYGGNSHYEYGSA